MVEKPLFVNLGKNALFIWGIDKSVITFFIVLG